jgi:GNAT superfamily N-acetyltransferase
MPEIRELASAAEHRDAVPILRQLWTDRDPDAVLEWLERDEYRAFGRFADGDLVGVAGVQVQSLLHHRRGAWLVDLVVDESRRGEGHGSELLAFVESWAGENDCEYVALASPSPKRASTTTTTHGTSRRGATSSRPTCERRRVGETERSALYSSSITRAIVTASTSSLSSVST